MGLQPFPCPEGRRTTAWHHLQLLRGCGPTCLCCRRLGLGLAGTDHGEGADQSWRQASGFPGQSGKPGHSASKHVCGPSAGQPLQATVLDCQWHHWRRVLLTVHESGRTCQWDSACRERCWPVSQSKGLRVGKHFHSDCPCHPGTSSTISNYLISIQSPCPWPLPHM